MLLYCNKCHAANRKNLTQCIIKWTELIKAKQFHAGILYCKPLQFVLNLSPMQKELCLVKYFEESLGHKRVLKCSEKHFNSILKMNKHF